MTEAVIEWLRGWPDLSFGSGLAVAAVFVLASAAFLPRALVLFAAGAIFGTKVIPFAWVGLVVGAMVAFLLSRFLLADTVQGWLSRSRSLRAVADAVDAEGWKIVALFRLGSPLSNSLQNYVFGVTRIRFAPYAVATAIFMAPQTALLIYLGAVGRQALAERGENRFHYLLFMVALLSLATALWLVWRKARAALRERGLDAE